MVLLAGGQLISGCKKWDDHTAVTDERLEKNLLQQIQANPNLSSFAGLLTKSGYDKEIASSKNYTVFAPVNAALASLDPAIVADPAKLRSFVGNHIASQLQTAPASGEVRLQTASGKYINFQSGKVEDATLTAKDNFTKNGYLHIIDKALPVLPSSWEFVQSGAQMPAKQKAFLSTLTGPAGENLFLRNVADISNEQQQYTFFVLTDAAWDTEVEKYKAFYATGTPDSTTALASSAVVRDVVVEGVYLPSSLPDTLVTKFNTKLGIDKNAIVQTVKLSNGIAYIMNKLDVRPQHKFQQYIIQAENYQFARADRRNNTYFRDKFNPVTNSNFRDVLVFNHGISQFYLGYRLNNVPALKYKAYWVALHDNINNNTRTFKQRLGIGAPGSTLLPYITVSPNTYQEVYLGEFTLSSFQPTLEVFLTADNSTNADANKITADYIRLEPAF